MYQDWKMVMVGAGTMGTGIGQIFASKGFDVTLVDQTAELLEKAAKTVSANCDYLISEGLADEAYKAEALKNIKYAPIDELEAVVKDADIVVEAVFERADIKREIYDRLNRFCRKDCIFCSNTSGSNVFEIATVDNPERFLITHWFNPPFIMELVEIVRGPETSDEVTEKVRELITYLGKKPSVIAKYVPGFIVNRLANALMREACSMVANGVTTPADIDNAIGATNGLRYAFEGPFALNDIVGWDLIAAVAKDLFLTLCNETDFPYAESLVAAGTLGLKTGKGAYDYEGINPADYMNERSTKIVKMKKTVQDL